MPGSSLRAWIVEQEKKRDPLVFASEWIVAFALAGVIWTATLSGWMHARPPAPVVIAVSALYASAMIYPRLLNATRCMKCRSVLPLLRREIERQHLRDREECVEFEDSGDAWGRHFIQLYRRLRSVDKVRYQCRRCHAVWQAVEDTALTEFELVRTIDLDDGE